VLLLACGINWQSPLGRPESEAVKHAPPRQPFFIKVFHTATGIRPCSASTPRPGSQLTSAL